MSVLFHWLLEESGADPGFPVGGGANPVFQKQHEIENILGCRGVRAGDAPLRSANEDGNVG